MEKIKITMDLTDRILEQVKDLFNVDVELMQGEKTKLPNGMWRIEIHVLEEKAMLFKEFIKRVNEVPTDQCEVSINGMKIHKN